MSRPPMHPLLKLLIVAAVLLGIYSGLMFMVAYVRFYDIKGKMEEAARNSLAESDTSLAVKLAETALDDKLPIAGDYFYQVRDDQGKVFVLRPETEQQQQEYLQLAVRYFMQNMQRGSGGFTISLAYDQEIYFPFNVYKHTVKFRHTEVYQQPR